jgi:hypothetical protein
MRWYETLVTIAAIAAIELMNYVSIYTAMRSREKDRLKLLDRWAEDEAERRYQERLRHTKWQVTANVELINESDIDWGDKE